MKCQNIYSTPYMDNATGSRMYYSDRDVNDTLQLPHDFTSVKIKPNDLVAAHVINKSIDKLYDNLLYIVSKSRVPQSNMPSKSGYTTFISTSSQAITGLNNMVSYNSQDLQNASYNFTSTHMPNMINGVFFANDSTYSNRGVVLVEHDNTAHFTMLQDTLSGYQCRAVTSRVDNFTNRLLSNQVIKTMVHGDIMYTATDKNQAIFKHDVAGLRNADESYFDPSQQVDGKLLLDVIGADGDVDDHTRFKQIQTMSNDTVGNLYVVDRHDHVVVKMYDKNSNYINSYRVDSVADHETIVDLCCVNNKFLLLTDTRVHEYTLVFTHLKTTVLRDDLINTNETTEQYKQIVPSVESPNVVYISTNTRVFKKFITRLQGNIGIFEFQGRGLSIDSDLMDVAFVSVTHGPTGDSVYVGDKSRGVIFRFDESMDYQHMLDTSYENTFYKLKDVMIKSDENVNYIVYNKMIAKLFHNHAIVGNSIRRKIVCMFNQTKYLQFKAVRYLLPQNVLTRNRKPTLKNFIGINEVVMSAVINRTLKYIYRLQQDLMYDLQVETLESSRTADMLETTQTLAETTWSYADGAWTVVE